MLWVTHQVQHRTEVRGGWIYKSEKEREKGKVAAMAFVV
jgi:hypothetical protein